MKNESLKKLGIILLIYVFLFTGNNAFAITIIGGSTGTGGGTPDDNSVSTDKIVNLAVTGGKIANGTITNIKLATGNFTAITGVDHLTAVGTITANAFIGSGAGLTSIPITPYMVTDNSITDAKLVTGSFPKITGAAQLTLTKGLGAVTANLSSNLNVSGNTVLTGTLETRGENTFRNTTNLSTFKALTSGGIAVYNNTGTRIGLFDGGGSCSFTTGCLSATQNVITKKLYASSAAGLAITDDSAVTTNGIFIQDLGNVGIGTITPQEKLAVVGNSIITGNSKITGSLSVTGNTVHTGTTRLVGKLTTNTGVSVNGVLTATTFYGSGAGLTNVPGATTGTSLALTQGLSAVTVNATGAGVIQGGVTDRGYAFTAATTIPTGYWQNIAYGNGLFVAVSYVGNKIATSTDGIHWYVRTAPGSVTWWSVCYGNGMFVAATYSGTSAMSSPDGITWTARTLPVSIGSNATDIAYGNGIFAMVGDGGKCVTSYDGITWTERTITSSQWSSITFGNNTFVAVSLTNGLCSSTDGITWTNRTPSISKAWNVVEYGKGLFVALAFTVSNSTYMTSPDGITWTSRTHTANTRWISLAYGNGVFIAGTSDGVGMSSTDGINWTARTLSAAQGLAYGNGVFVGCRQDYFQISGFSRETELQLNGKINGPLNLSNGVSIGSGTAVPGVGNLIVTGSVKCAGLLDTTTANGHLIITYNVTQVVPTQVYSTMNTWIEADVLGVTHSSGVITITKAGWYRLNFNINLDKENDTDDIEGGISINSAEPAPELEWRSDSNSSGFNFVGAASDYKYLAAGTTVCMKVQNLSSNTRYVIFRSCNFLVIKE